MNSSGRPYWLVKRDGDGHTGPFSIRELAEFMAENPGAPQDYQLMRAVPWGDE